MIIELENISNARDLGGMIGANNRKIKNKRLIRSSCLFGSSENDANKLIKDYNLVHVVDFRSEDERKEKPHDTNLYKNVEYSFLQSFGKIKEVFTRDKKSTDLLLKKSEDLTVEKAIEIIEVFYRQLPVIESLQLAYKKFLEILLDTKEGSVLWHCSLGKDRAGMAAVIIEYILGVSLEDIMKDYMLTNQYLKKDFVLVKNNAFRVFYGVRESFLETWLETVNKKYGSFDNYLKDQLNIDENKIEQLRNNYLE